MKAPRHHIKALRRLAPGAALTRKEHGLTPISALVACALLGILVVLAVQTYGTLKFSQISARRIAKVEDLRSYVRSGVSCSKTMYAEGSDVNLCSPYKGYLKVLDQYGRTLIQKAASDGSTSFALGDFLVRAFCRDDTGTRMSIEYQDKTRAGTEWKDLFGDLPFECPNPCAASRIDFERLPDGRLPVQGTSLTTQYFASHGVTFSAHDRVTGERLDEGPIVAQRDVLFSDAAVDPGLVQAFTCIPGEKANCVIGADDAERQSNEEKMGRFFLTDDTRFDNAFAGPDLIITYRYPTARTSGVIWDVDGTEEVWIQARDKSGNVLVDHEPLRAADGPFNGKPRRWFFDRGPGVHDIYSVRIHLDVGSQGGGLAFDDFYADCVVATP